MRARVPDAVRILTVDEEAEREAARRAATEAPSQDPEASECAPADTDENGLSMCGACVESGCGEDACGYGSCGA